MDLLGLSSIRLQTSRIRAYLAFIVLLSELRIVEAGSREKRKTESNHLANSSDFLTLETLETVQQTLLFVLRDFVLKFFELSQIFEFHNRHHQQPKPHVV